MTTSQSRAKDQWRTYKCFWHPQAPALGSRTHIPPLRPSSGNSFTVSRLGDEVISKTGAKVLVGC